MSEKLRKYVCLVTETKKVTYECRARDEKDARRLIESGQCGYYPKAENSVEKIYGPIMEIRHDFSRRNEEYKVGGSNGD